MTDTEIDRPSAARRDLERLKQRLLLDAPLFDDPAAYAAGVNDTIDALRAEAAPQGSDAAAAPRSTAPAERTRVVRIPPPRDTEAPRSGHPRVRSASTGDG